jgi:nitrate reductase gamma subunit
MLISERIIVSVSILWAIIALLVHWVSDRGSGRKDYSARRGSPFRGILYNFTWAMLPSHKESIRLYPFHFTVGVLMHIGVFVAIAKVLVLLINPQGVLPAHGIVVLTLAIADICALFLLFRRIFTREMRSMSSIDDYLSILLVADFVTAALLSEFGVIGSGTFLIHATVLFFYLPLGKLKHALFFFIARADYGARLGYRGTYPARQGAGK